MTKITKYSVVECDVDAIHTAIQYLLKNGSLESPEYKGSVIGKLYTDDLAHATIDEAAFVAEFRKAFHYGLYPHTKTLTLKGGSAVVIYYNDAQTKMIHDTVKNNYMTVQQTSFLSPKQAAFASGLHA